MAFALAGPTRAVLSYKFGWADPVVARY